MSRRQLLGPQFKDRVHIRCVSLSLAPRPKTRQVCSLSNAANTCVLLYLGVSTSPTPLIIFVPQRWLIANYSFVGIALSQIFLTTFPSYTGGDLPRPRQPLYFVAMV